MAWNDQRLESARQAPARRAIGVRTRPHEAAVAEEVDAVDTVVRVLTVDLAAVATMRTAAVAMDVVVISTEKIILYA